MKQSKLFQYLLGFIAIVIAGVAAYFSVFGISKLFAGAMFAAIVMATALESGKLILVSYLYRFWVIISKQRRVYGTLAVAVLMFITSVGIYGFLSNAYEKTSMKLEQQDSKIEIVDTRLDSKQQEKDRYIQLIDDKQNRINTLTELRKSQEVRWDSLVAGENWINASRTTSGIKTADIEIGKLYTEIDNLNVKIDTSNSQIIALKTDKLNFKTNDNISAEVGPLKYVSRLLNVEMDRVVNWVIILLILVFDPLAIYLILSYNHLAMANKRKDKIIKDKIAEEIIAAEEKIDVKKVVNNEKKSYIKTKEERFHEKLKPDNRAKELFNKFFAEKAVKEEVEIKEVEEVENVAVQEIEVVVKEEVKEKPLIPRKVKECAISKGDGRKTYLE